MRCLSGRQPWWWAILHAGKRIENRRWNTRYRGPVLLHASKGCTVDEYEDARVWMENAGVIVHVNDVPALSAMRRGGIVGRARIVNVIPKGSSDGVAVEVARFHGADPRWWMSDQYGFVLADVEPVEFIACNGELGLFPVPAALRSRFGVGL